MPCSFSPPVPEPLEKQVDDVASAGALDMHGFVSASRVPGYPLDEGSDISWSLVAADAAGPGMTGDLEPFRTALSLPKYCMKSVTSHVLAALLSRRRIDAFWQVDREGSKPPTPLTIHLSSKEKSSGCSSSKQLPESRLGRCVRVSSSPLRRRFPGNDERVFGTVFSQFSISAVPQKSLLLSDVEEMLG